MHNINIHDIHTFDSGLGGLFTAKAFLNWMKDSLLSSDNNIVKILARRGHFFKITHFGDTENSPYGNLSEGKITELTSRALLYSFSQNAEKVFIACNTASTQWDKIKTNIPMENDVISIVDETVENLVDKVLSIDEQNIHFGLFATRATVNSGAYPKILSDKLRNRLHKCFDVMIRENILENKDHKNFSYGKSIIDLTPYNGGQKNTIHLNQYAPHKWVDIIEGGADVFEKYAQVNKDIENYMNVFRDASKCSFMGLFCTHYPALGNNILQTFGKNGLEFPLISQAEIMRQVFETHLKKASKKIVRLPIVYNDDLLYEAFTQKECGSIIYNVTLKNTETKKVLQTLFGNNDGNTDIKVQPFSFDNFSNRFIVEMKKEGFCRT